MWSKCKQLCRLQAEVLCRLSSSFCSIPFHFVSFRSALMASHGIAILIAMQKCVCHFWNWKAAGRGALLLHRLYVCGRGPHCSLAVAFYCLLLGVNWETARPTDTFGVPARCQDRSKNYACHRKLFELGANDGRRQQTPPLSSKELKKHHTKKEARDLHDLNGRQQHQKMAN